MRTVPTITKDVSLEWDDFKDMDAVEDLLEHVYSIENHPSIYATLTFSFIKGHPGMWYRSNGDPGDPPEPDEVECVSLLSVHFPGDMAKCLWNHLTESAQQRLDDVMMEAGREWVADEKYANDEYQYEQERERQLEQDGPE